MANALVIRTAGTNCDGELVRAFRTAGAQTQLVHLDRLIEDPSRLEPFDLIGFPGGFSYGDDIASGRLFAMRVRERLYPALREAVERGCMIIGICNGFQVLVQVGLLPGPAPGESLPEDVAPRQSVTLTDNAGDRFIDRWVGVQPVEGSVCLWTRDLERADEPDIMQLPIAHGEGRFVADSPERIRALNDNGQVVLRYTDNVNGSAESIAGICDATGRVFGLMPHPERYLDWNRHPYWTRLDPSVRSGETPGLMMFRHAVASVAEAIV